MIEHLQHGVITVLGRHPQASNSALVVECVYADVTVRAMYKPVQGERPLWDFPDAVLAAREVAAYDVAVALGFQFIPPTIWRDDGPAGPGSLQLWIDEATIQDVIVTPEPAEGWLPVLQAQLADGTDVVVAHRDTADLRALALLDAVMNNADRKAGHLLRDQAGTLWAVDHGVTFHADPKLRTVLWGFAGDPIEPSLLAQLDVALHELSSVQQALQAEEIEALAERVAALQTSGAYPFPSPDWPAVPWPIY